MPELPELGIDPTEPKARRDTCWIDAFGLRQRRRFAIVEFDPRYY